MTPLKTPLRMMMCLEKGLRLTKQQMLANGQRRKTCVPKASMAYQQYRHGGWEDVGDRHGLGYGIGRRPRLRGDDRSVGGADHDRRRGVDCMGGPGGVAMDFAGGDLTNG
jgi:hypothetical protein